jgi:hypothetical protein
VPVYLLVPVVIVGAAVVLVGLLAFLARFRKGRYLRPLVAGIAKVPFMKRLLQKASTAALERQNPELVSVMRKLERAGQQNDPVKIQQALHGLSPAERRAYHEYLALAQEQGQVPEAPNRKLRRLQERQVGQPRPGGARRRKRR